MNLLTKIKNYFSKPTRKPSKRLTVEDIITIDNMIVQGYSKQQILSAMSISETTYYRIRNGKHPLQS